MLNGPFSPWPAYTEEEAAAVKRVLLSNRVNYWTGEEGRAFEQEFADFIGSRFAIAVSSGTTALDLALKGLQISAGDEIIVTSRTFLASASCIVNAGATPVFADVDRNSQNITPTTVAPLIGPRTRAILAVHLAGWPCEMHGLRRLAERHDLCLIEDCAQAHGARYHGLSVGRLGDVAAWSFCQDKIMTTGGEGGMVTTNDPALWERMWAYKDHGKSWEDVHQRRHPPGFRWLHDSIGTNWRLTEMQAALGRIQLRRLPEWHARRRDNARGIWEAARQCPGLRAPEPPAHIDHAAYKAYVFVEPHRLVPGWDRDRILAEIMTRGVPCFSGSCSEIYLERAFAAAPDHADLRPPARREIARELGETSLMFLCHPTLTAHEVALAGQVLQEVMHQAAGMPRESLTS